MKAWCLVIAAFMASTPLCSHACSPADPNAEEAKKASTIVSGMALGNRWVEPSTLVVHVVVKNIIKGIAPTGLDAISPCAMPIDDGEAVYVFVVDGRAYVYLTELYGESIKTALSAVQQ